MQVLYKQNRSIFLCEVESRDGFERTRSFVESCLTAAVNEHEPTSLLEAACLSPALRQGVGKDSGPTAYSPINQGSSAEVGTIISELKLGEAKE